MQSEEFFNRMVKALGIILDRRPKGGEINEQYSNMRLEGK
jgi:hypothetical protein